MITHLRTPVALTVCCLMGATASYAQWMPGPAVTGASQRVHAAGVMVNGALLAIGGTPWNGTGQDGSVHVLNMGTQLWNPLPVLETGPITGLAAGVDGLGRIVTYGGVDASNGDRGPVKTYDPATGETVDLAEYPSEAAHTFFASCADANKRLYVMGGGPGRAATTSNFNKSNAFRYDATTDSWTMLPPMSAGVGDAAGVYDGTGHILVIGGVAATGGSRTSNVARFDIATNTWSDTAIPDMPVAVSGARAALGTNGWIYVVGGESGALLAPTIIRSTWVYRPDLNAWHQGPDMATDRRFHMLVAGPEDHLYVVGGESNTGPLNTCEKLYTPPPPQFNPGPSNVNGWLGQTVVFEANASGGVPLQYTWKLNGIELSDGPVGSASTVSGAHSASLAINNAQADVAGPYTVEVSNPSGSVTSSSVSMTLRVPPQTGSKVFGTALHPGWAQNSNSYGVHYGVPFGASLRPFSQWTNVSVATQWSLPSGAANTVVGPSSAGGSISAWEGNFRVGWWWWPYQVLISGVWHTAYSMQPCIYKADGTFVNLQVSGWEYGRAIDTDGTIVVGSISTDDASGNVYAAGVYWTQNAFGNWSPHQLGSGYGTQSSCSFVYGGRIYGGQWERGVNFTGVHQGYWDLATLTWHEFTSPGATSFSISAGHSGQLVGTATIGGVQKATLWSPSGGTEIIIHPVWAASSALSSVHEGIQAGNVVVGTASHAAIWAGSAQSCVDLHDYCPRGTMASYATGVEVQADGTILVVGTININRGTGVRNEAYAWRIPTKQVSVAR